MFHVFLQFPEWKKRLKYFDVENECVDEEQTRNEKWWKKIKGKSLSPKTLS